MKCNQHILCNTKLICPQKGHHSKKKKKKKCINDSIAATKVTLLFVIAKVKLYV